MKQFATFEEHIAAVESWLSGEEDRVAGDLLKQRGFVVAEPDSLSESRLRKALREMIDALAAEKIYLDCTDHLSDRELYESICDEVLPQSFAVGGDDFDLYDFSHYYDEETRDDFLAYYADDEERQIAAEDGIVVPARRALPYDRDRTLPRPADWNEFYA